MEKLLKIERSQGVPKLNPDTIEVVPNPLDLELINIDPYTEPRTTIHIDLELDQIEDTED